LRRLIAATRRPALRPSARLGCLRLEDRTIPASFQGLGFLPGSTNNSYVTGLSTNGSVAVGNSYVNGSGDRAFPWAKGTGMVDLGLLPGGLYADATGVSGDGSIVVGYCYVGSHLRAFSWTATTGMVEIGAMPGVTGDTFARAISADGSTIVGRSGAHAFRL